MKLDGDLSPKNILRAVLRHFPRTRAVLSRLNNQSRFHRLGSEELAQVSRKLSGSWLDDDIPKQQRKAVDLEISAYRDGQPSSVFDALIDILLHNIPGIENKSLLEVGCSSGYYSEILACRNVLVSYQGCDFSPSFIEMARRHYPLVQFKVEDATQLGYPSGSFDIVVSGCCLLHIAEYEKAISEAARVSREFVAFHRTPTLHLSGPSFYTKRGYGKEMLEIHFNEQALVRLFRANGLNVIDINSHKAMPEVGQAESLIYKTYLCRKVS